MKFLLLLFALQCIGYLLFAQEARAQANNIHFVKNPDSVTAILGSNEKGVRGVFYKKNNRQVEFRAGDFHRTSDLPSLHTNSRQPAITGVNHAVRGKGPAVRPMAKSPSPGILASPPPALPSHH